MIWYILGYIVLGILCSITIIYYNDGAEDGLWGAIWPVFAGAVLIHFLFIELPSIIISKLKKD